MAQRVEVAEQAVGPFYDFDGARAVLGVAPDELDALVAAGRVLALTTGDESVVFPSAQFRADGRPAPGLAAVLDRLRKGTSEAWMWALWLTAQNDDWQGLSAFGWLTAGHDPDMIIRAAAADAACWAT